MEEKSPNGQNEIRTPSPAAAPAQTPAPRPGKKESWLELLRFAILTALIVVPIRVFVAQPFIVSGASMDPTFENGQYLIVDELSYRFESPQRGDVVVFKFPQEGRYLIKRIVGLPNETVILDSHTVTVKDGAHPEGLKITEPYVAYGKDEPQKTFTLGPKQYFVMGDNRPVSYDSRSWGPLSADQIVGRPIFRLYPISTLSLFPGGYTQALGATTTP